MKLVINKTWQTKSIWNFFLRLTYKYLLVWVAGMATNTQCMHVLLLNSNSGHQLFVQELDELTTAVVRVTGQLSDDEMTVCGAVAMEQVSISDEGSSTGILPSSSISTPSSKALWDTASVNGPSSTSENTSRSKTSPKSRPASTSGAVSSITASAPSGSSSTTEGLSCSGWWNSRNASSSSGPSTSEASPFISSGESGTGGKSLAPDLSSSSSESMCNMALSLVCVGKLERSLGEAAPKGLSPGPLGASIASRPSLKDLWSIAWPDRLTGPTNRAAAPIKDRSFSAQAVAPLSHMPCEPWEPVGERPTETTPGRWCGRSSSSDGVPGAPFKDELPMIESGEAPRVDSRGCMLKKTNTFAFYVENESIV